MSQSLHISLMIHYFFLAVIEVALPNVLLACLVDLWFACLLDCLLASLLACLLARLPHSLVGCFLACLL